jgi:NADPH2:quinone reductase
MRAVVISKPGGPEVMDVVERPVPEFSDDQILIHVHAAGINRPDIAQRKGNYPAPAWAPQDIPGLEVAGVVEKTGSRCTRLKSGDRIVALLSGGGYADYAVAQESHCLPLPNDWSYTDAAGLPEAVFTVWHNVFERGKLQAGETLLIHGGTSGIGITAIQLAKTFGAEVITTCGTNEKCALAKKLGASQAINYKDQDFKEAVLNFTAGKGVSVILDMVGGLYTQSNLEILAPDGRLCLINFMGGYKSEINLATILSRRLTLTGSTLRARDNEFKAMLTRSIEKSIWPVIQSGKFIPVTDSIFDIENVREAHQRMESGAHAGKIILNMNP